jgi:hypothetical protein
MRQKGFSLNRILNEAIQGIVFKHLWFEHFQQKCAAVLRRIMRENKWLERFRPL